MPDTPAHDLTDLDPNDKVHISASQHDDADVDIWASVDGDIETYDFAVALNREGKAVMVFQHGWTVAEAVRALTDLALVLSDNKNGD